jgi:2-polyprenyl-3-methyl-5-hydroxy-6-metoxy-1,4-benzoquinol methylase
MTQPFSAANSRDFGLSANTQKVIDKILEDSPLHRRFLTSSLSLLTGAEKTQLGDYVDFCISRDLTTEYLAESYLMFVTDTMREQIYFQKHKKYRYSSFAEVANHVYFNNEYMSHYMYAQALTLFFWPNHLGMYRFFQETLPQDNAGKYLEIGPGHGTFLNYAMNNCRFGSYLGVDISETSVAQTQALLDYYQRGRAKKNFLVQCADFLSADLAAGTFDAIIMGEVLEHVEQPDVFMKRIAELATDDAYIYITTCIDAPIVDHIYLFTSTAEIEKLFNDCGLTIVRELFLPYEGKTVQESLQSRLPISTAYVLKKT